jgi:hypothetical protein
MQQASQAPPVDVCSMAYLFYYLRGQILRSSTDGIGSLFVLQNLGKAKVCEFNVTDSIDDDVLGFEAEWRQSYSRYITLFLCRISSASTICAQ